MSTKKPVIMFLVLLLNSWCMCAQTFDFPIYRDSTKNIENRIEDLLARMTLEEKIAQVSGEGFSTVGNARLGIPKIIMYDEQAERKAKRHTINFSATINWAATFDYPLIERVGVSMGEEVRVMGANMLLNPCINILRTPFHGRSFEALGEDPFLVSKIAVAYVTGAQSKRVIACPKHFATNNQEWNRFSVDVHVDERALQEIYFPGYKAAIQEGGAWSVMTAYNKLLGHWCGESEYLLTDVLRRQWGFTGFSVSDWGGTHSTVGTAVAGLDLEMPEGRFMGKDLLTAVKAGQVHERVIDAKVRNILRVMFKAGLFDETPAAYGGMADTPSRRALAREVAQKSIVLLKNEHGFLPLDRKKYKSIAVIGPNGNVARMDGGGSGEYYGYYQISPLQGLVNKLAQGCAISYVKGIPDKLAELPYADSTFYLLPDSDTEHGVIAEYFNNRTLAGTPALTRKERAIDFDWGYGAIRAGGGPGSPDPNIIQIDQWSARWRGKLVPPDDGIYEIGVQADNGVRLYLDGKVIIDSWTDSKPSKFKIARYVFQKNRTVDFKLEFYENWGSCMCKLGMAPYNPAAVKGDAVALAKNSDLVIMCMGLDPELEGEATDREELSLPEEQIALAKELLAVNKNSVMVLYNGNPITMAGWVEDVPAIIDALYPGQEGGNALADILFGDVNPSGRLPMTFPARWEDSPAYQTYPGEMDNAYYKEGLYVGYRHFDKKNIAPLFAFGHGLSYSTFAYGDIQMDTKKWQTADTLCVLAKITNTGQRAGDEVVQLYVHDVKASVDRPVKELKGFTRVSLAPGESKTIRIYVPKSAFSFYDIKNHDWTFEPGEFDIILASSSVDIRLNKRISLK
jgi:beta-glucosidase